jgi:acyl-CoA thioesterase FadM
VQNVFIRFYVDFFDVVANGWINGGVYFQYNDRLFEDLLRKNGRTLKELLERGFGFPRSITRSIIGRPAPMKMN